MNTITTLRTVDLEKFLTRASAIIKALGYVSNSEAKEKNIQSTSELAWSWADDNKPREIISLSFDYADKATAKEVADWMVSLMTNVSYMSKEANDYVKNLERIGMSKVVGERDRGYAASAIRAFEKDKAKSLDESKKLEKFIGCLGKVGEKFQGINVIFIGQSQFSSRFGLCHKYQFEDSEGRNITWMTSTELRGLVEQKPYTMDGTIKEYSSFKGKNECQVTRVKFR